MTEPLTKTLEELKELSDFFKKAEETLKSGQDIDMSGIDARISRICQIVETAPPEEQEHCLPELNSLLNLLNSCELALHNLHLVTPANGGTDTD